MIFASIIVLAAIYLRGEAKDYDFSSNSSADLGICGYSATCSAGGYTGACVSIGAGCCNGGGVTSGLCPGKFNAQ